ncbi:hypothetical protein [Mycobacterium sp. HUMS_1102779]
MRLTAWVGEGDRLAEFGDTEPQMPQGAELRELDAVAAGDATGDE